MVGVASMDELIAQAVPASIRQQQPLELGAPLSEAEAIARLREIASRNQTKTSLIGMGYYGTVLPAVIQRNVLESPAWYTAYTPYQPEISQGRLEALINFQTMITDLTGLDIAVMGCIVNGPGEMADADYGYVGKTPGTISLYRGRDEIRRVPEAEGVDALIALIKEDGRWVDPE